MDLGANAGVFNEGSAVRTSASGRDGVNGASGGGRAMSETETSVQTSEAEPTPHADLPAAAQRALAEAAARRAARETEPFPATERPPEIDGRKSGVEPVRYGDWEKNGLISDF
jgi:hypothetical protein